MIQNEPTPGGPRGRWLYLLAIDRLPENYEPNLRAAAAKLRDRRLRIRLFASAEFGGYDEP